MKAKTKNKKIQQEMEMMAAKLLSVNSVLLFPHVNMDGDCLGSSVALCKGLRILEKTAYVLIEDEVPANLSFLDNSYCTYDQNIIENPDICMTVDLSLIERFAKRKEKFLQGETLMC